MLTGSNLFAQSDLHTACTHAQCCTAPDNGVWRARKPVEEIMIYASLSEEVHENGAAFLFPLKASQ